MRIAKVLARTWVPIALAFALVAGCDDDDDDAGKTISIVAPSSGAALGCADDRDLTTPDTVEVNVEALVGLGADNADGLVAQLSINGGAAIEQTVPASGLVIFGSASLPLGDVTLRVTLFENGAEVSTSTQAVSVVVVEGDPACVAPPQPSLSFTAPSDALGRADDKDGDLTNDLQVDVVIAAEGLIGDAVELEINGGQISSANIVEGVARFEDVTITIGDGQAHQTTLTAIGQGLNGLVREEMTVSVSIDGCQVTLSPAPIEGCDFGPAADVDPEAAGLQVDLTASSDCAEVVFSVDGAAGPTVAVVDGQAVGRVTFTEGENVVVATASTVGGLTGDSGELVYSAAVEIPTASVTVAGVFTLSDAVSLDPVMWRLEGQSDGVEADGEVALTFEPAFVGAPATATVAADGSFGADIIVPDNYYLGTVTVSTSDACGGSHAAEPVAVTFDGVQPLVQITAPGVDAPLIAAGDTDLEREGVQLTFNVEVEDPRAAVDYLIGIECAQSGGAFTDRTTGDGDTILRMADGDITVTLTGSDDGELVCRPFVEASPNEAVVEETTYRVVLEQPNFAVVTPAVLADGAACFTDEVPIGGLGMNLDDNGAALSAVVTPEGGEAMAPVAMSGAGGDQYAVTFGADGGPEGLDDGAYSVSVVGEVVGGIAVVVSPETVPFVVDTVAPVVGLSAPAPNAVLGIGEDADSNLANCVQTTLSLQLDDATATEVCYRLNGGQATCGAAADGAWTSEQVTLLEGTNDIVVEASDCAGNSATQAFTVETAGCPPRIIVAEPSDGTRLAVSSDADLALPGYQLDVTLSSALPIGTLVSVRFDGGIDFGPVPINVDGQATVQISVAHAADRIEPLLFTLQGRVADGSSIGPEANITLLFQPPAIDVVAPGCVGSAVIDASLDDGFQVVFEADALRVDEGTVATLDIVCGDHETQVSGTSVAGHIAFDPATVPEDAICTLTAHILDAAGQEGVGVLEGVRIDRVAPSIEFTKPTDGQELGVIDDEVPGEGDANGFQLTPRVRVCGAAGQTLAITMPSGAAEAVVGEGDCATVSFERQTLPLGQVNFTAGVTDACGNATEVTATATVDNDAVINIVAPSGPKILAIQDLEPGVNGCQLNVRSITSGFAQGAEFTVCTDFPQGEGPALCQGASGAVTAGSECRLIGELANEVSCPVTLEEGLHTLVVVGRFGARIESEGLALTVDCVAPTVETITTLSDANGDGCVNRHERDNLANEGTDNATVRMHVATGGLEDGRGVTLFSMPGEVNHGTRAVANNQADWTVSLASAERTFYVTGYDNIGNPLPGFDEAGSGQMGIEIDTLQPAPALVNLVADRCLNADDDEVAGGVLQYGVQAELGRRAGMEVLVSLIVDGAEAEQQRVSQDQLTFAALNLVEGPHAVGVTVMDACGNIGSAAGFDQVGGTEDWTAPRSVAMRVDTIAPGLTLAGVVADQVLTDGDDSDAAAAGLQIQLTANFAPADGLENGQSIEFTSGGQALVTAPSPVLFPTRIANVTLPPGNLNLAVRAQDTCGNVGASEAVSVQVDISGCPSQLIGFASNPQTFADGGMNVSGTIDLVNASCATAQASLLIDGAVVGAAQVVGVDGAVSFAGVEVPAGQHNIVLRIEGGGDITDSLPQQVVVDLTNPVVVFARVAGQAPDGVAPVLVLTDSDGADGQQGTIRVSVTEANVASARTAQLSVDGVPAGAAVDVNDGSPADVIFAGVTLPAGVSTLRVVVTDAAGREGSAEVQVNADPAAPADFVLDPTVVDSRSTEVTFGFTAAGDDGRDNGPVAHYEIRRASTAIADDLGWNSAELLDSLAPVVAPGQAELLTVNGLELNAVHHVAIRAVDDAGRMSALNSVIVDLRLNQAEAVFGGWGDDIFSQTTSLVQGVGDVDNDGFDDALVFGLDGSFTAQGALVFGAADPGDVELLMLSTAPAISGTTASPVGDVDGDGHPDFAVSSYDAAFAYSRISIFFGCDGCARADVVAADVFITTDHPDLVTDFGAGTFDVFTLGVWPAGNFTQHAGDPAGGYDDILVGGNGFGAADHAYVISGRSRADWLAASPINTYPADAAAGVIHLQAAGHIRLGEVAVALGDVNGDGLDDLALTADNFGQVFAYYGRDDMPDVYAYAPAAIPAQTFDVPHPCDTGDSTTYGSFYAGGIDLDGDVDGRPDFLVGDRSLKRIAVFNQDLAPIECFSRGEDSFGQAFDLAGDVDGDGHQDVVVTHMQDGINTAYILYNDGEGHFGIGADAPPVARGVDVVLGEPGLNKLGVAGVGDFNGDGRDDVATAVKDPGGALRIIVYY